MDKMIKFKSWVDIIKMSLITGGQNLINPYIIYDLI